jgi:Rne/Rng family ribonuclease
MRMVRTSAGRLEDFVLLPRQEGAAVGDIYLGRVAKVVPGIDAAFIDLGDGETGFLNLARVRQIVTAQGLVSPHGPIKQGRDLLVQVTKQAHGDKVATVDARLSLAGFFSVLLIHQPGLRLSRALKQTSPTSGDLFAGWAKAHADHGWILRAQITAAQPSWVETEAAALLTDWERIRGDAAAGGTRRLMHQESWLVALREMCKQAPRRIVIDDYELHHNLSEYLRTHHPGLLPCLNFHGDDLPLFDVYRLESQIESLSAARVWLKSGGSLRFFTSEAMATIDVDSGKSTKSGKELSAAMRTNLEAVSEIARQIRARNLGGLIVIDFINATDRNWRKTLDRTLREAFAEDDAALDIEPLSKLGIAQISRERKGPALSQTTHEPCPVCKGSGHVKRTVTVALDLQRDLMREIDSYAGEEVVLECGPALTAYLEEHRAQLLAPLEQRFQLRFRITKGKREGQYRIGL